MHWNVYCLCLTINSHHVCCRKQNNHPQIHCSVAIWKDVLLVLLHFPSTSITKPWKSLRYIHSLLLISSLPCWKVLHLLSMCLLFTSKSDITVFKLFLNHRTLYIAFKLCDCSKLSTSVIPGSLMTFILYLLRSIHHCEKKFLHNQNHMNFCYLLSRYLKIPKSLSYEKENVSDWYNVQHF